MTEPTNKPLRAATYAALDAARRKAQDAEEEARRLWEPEPGIKCTTYHRSRRAAREAPCR